MPPTIRFKSENYAGKTARVTFIPNDSGVPPLDLGLHTLPSDYTPPTELYSGEYRFNFEDLEKICSASILAPTPSPTPTLTPTPPWTPTPTPTLTQTPTVTQTRTPTLTPTLTPTSTTAPAVTVLHLRGEGLDGQQNNAFQDSANIFNITRTGTVTQGSFTPFTVAGVTYNPSTHSGSGYFDRNSFLTASAAISLFTGTTWTIEAWVYMLPGGTQYTLINSVPHTVIDISLNRTGSGDTYVYIGNGATWTGGGPSIIANAFLSFNIWHHIALVRNGATITLYQNGVNVGTTTNLPTGYSGPLYIGSIGGAEYFNGFISNLRATIHAAYTTFFTRPASPVTLTSNGGATPSVLPGIGQVSLLCNFTNGGVIDSACRHDVTTVGNSKISTALSRCNEGSISFDGNGDYLTIPSSSDFAFGTGDFTVEAWVYPTGTTGYKAIFSTRSAVITTPTSFIVGLNTGNTSAFWYANGFLLVNAQNIGLNTWAHVAVSRQGTTLRLFVDGVLISTAFNNDNLTSTLGTVGANADGSEPFIGNIDNLKITKNAALYTSNFTPSDCPAPPPTPTPTSTKPCPPNTYQCSSNVNTNINVNLNTTTIVDCPITINGPYGGTYYVKPNLSSQIITQWSGTAVVGGSMTGQVLGSVYVHGNLTYDTSRYVSGYQNYVISVNTENVYVKGDITGNITSNTGNIYVHGNVYGNVSLNSGRVYMKAGKTISGTYEPSKVLPYPTVDPIPATPWAGYPAAIGTQITKCAV